MSKQRASHSDLAQLVEKLVGGQVGEGGLSNEEHDQLTRLLAGDADAQRRYLELLNVHALLAEEFGAAIESALVGTAPVDDATATDAPLTVTRRQAWFSKHITRTSIAITAAIFIAVAGILAFVSAPEFADNDTSGDDISFVAQLARSYEPVWEGGAPDARRLRVGTRLAIQSGLIEVVYDTGARVVIEGPAEFYVGVKEKGDRTDVSPSYPSDNSGYLAVGRLTATVAAQEAAGFTIETDSATFVDFGTEFEVHVPNDREADIVVLEGAVECVREDADGREQRIELTQGNAGYFEKGATEYRPIPADDARVRTAMRRRVHQTYRLRTSTNVARRTIAATNFSRIHRAGNTAAEIPWIAFDVLDPGDLTCVEDDGDGVDELLGLFETFAAQKFFAPRLNIGTEGGWSTTVRLTPTADRIPLDSVVIDYQHFNVEGMFQGTSAPRGATWTASIIDSQQQALGHVDVTIPPGPRNAGRVTLAFDEPVVLNRDETYHVKIAVSGIGDIGNHTGIGRLLLLRHLPARESGDE